MSVKITNKEIYDKLLEVEKHVMQTNGKVKLAHWIGSTALSLVLILVGLSAGGVL